MLLGNLRKVAPARTRHFAWLTAALLWASANQAALAATDPGQQPAIWVQKELNFRYVGYTTKYSCDGLMDRMRGILLKLGARKDLKLTGYGCLGVNSPEATPGVRIVMHVLQPAGTTAGQTIAAHWRSVDLLADRDLLDAARDCELIAQLDRDVLPLFAARHVDYSATCSAHEPVVGGTRLKADVLVADAAPPGAAPPGATAR
jgi:hypothetical protein